VLQSWSARYLDGVSAHAVAVTLTPAAHGLDIRRADGGVVVWPYADISQTQGHYPGEQVRLERGVELLVVDDTAILSQLHKVAPRVSRRFHDPKWRVHRPALVAGALVAAIALGAGIYFWAIPAVAVFVAEQIPVAWEEELGRVVTDTLTDSKSTCQDQAVTRAVDDIVARLAAGVSDNPYTFRVSVIQKDVVNAFAAPGGHMVVFSGLLRRTDRPEELAGVLAHEMSHVLRRHGTKALFRDVSTSIFLSAIIGDAGGAMGVVLESAKTLGNLHYSRQAENEADTEGRRMLIAARIDPAGLVSFFEKLEKKDLKIDKDFLKYLSSHPLTEERIARLKPQPGAARVTYAPLPMAAIWKTLATACDPEEPD